MCLRSVHLLLSFRFRFGFRTSNRFLSLHYVCFISPTSAPHSISGSVTPYHKIHAVIPFRSTVAYLPTLKTLQTLQDLQPSSHKSNQLNSIAFPNALCHSVPSPPMLFSNANPMVYFHSLRRVSPIKRLSGREVCLLHLNGAFLAYRQLENNAPKTIYNFN